MFKSRLALGLAALTLGGLVYAISPALTPQAPVIEATEHHKILQPYAGSWEGTISMYMPGAEEPMPAPCTEVITSVGELWITTRFEMDFMGTKFTGSGTTGYDTAKGKFVGSWIDSMSTTLTMMEGEYDEAKKAIVMHYEMMDETGEMRPVRSENSIDGDTYSMKFISLKDGKETPIMKIEMKRASAAVEAKSTK